MRLVNRWIVSKLASKLVILRIKQVSSDGERHCDYPCGRTDKLITVDAVVYTLIDGPYNGTEIKLSKGTDDVAFSMLGRETFDTVRAPK